ncbi:MAG: hypothetical protein ACTSVL_11650 [Promethearchaeota archaeon]
MILQFDPTDMLNSLLGMGTILFVAIGVAILVAWFIGAAFLSIGIQAGDGDEDASFGSRLGTVLIVLLLNGILPIIGLFIGISLIGKRHDMNFGKSTLCYLVWSFLTGLVVSVVLLIILLIGGGAALLSFL